MRKDTEDTRPVMPCYTKAEASRVFGYSRSAVEQWLLKGLLVPCRTAGGQEMVTEESVRAWKAKLDAR